MSWQPLRSDDPLPGEPLEIATYADELSATADLINEQAAMLTRLADPANWVSESADAFREQASDLAQDITKAEGRYRTVGSELSGWSEALAESQRRAGQLRDQAIEQERIAAANPEPTPTPPADGIGPAELTPAQDQQQARGRGAADELDRLRGEFDRLAEETREQAWEHGRKIRSALGDDVADGWFAGIKAWLSSISDVLKTVAKWAGYIALAIGVLALIIALVFTPVGWLIILGAAVTAVSLLANVGLALSENGSWWNVAFDAVALATFGVGKITLNAGKAAMALARPAAGVQRAAAARAASLARSPRLLNAAQRIGGSRWLPGLVRRPAHWYQGMRVGRADEAADVARATVDVMPRTTFPQRVLFGAKDPAGIRNQARQFLTEFPDVVDVAVPARVAVTNINRHMAALTIGDLSSIIGTYVKEPSATSDAGVVRTIIGRLVRGRP